MNRLQELFRNEILLGTLVFFTTLSVYHSTMCPTVSFTDSGELAAVATTLGIAHPTGYPLWTLLARIAVMVPTANEEIARLNVFSVVLTAFAAALFFKLVLVCFDSPSVFRFKQSKFERSHVWVPAFTATVVSLVVGFSSTFWSQSVEIEVYALHLVLLILCAIFFISGIEQQLAEPRKISSYLLFFSFVLGASFSNHMTTVLLAPGFLYLYFSVFGFSKRSWIRILIFIPFFLLGLSLYLYLPVRSGAGTHMDWGHPVTLERFWWHFTGKQYQTWMFSGVEVMKKQLIYFLSNFPTEFHWMVICVLLVGIVWTLIRSRRLLLFLALMVVGCVAYAINYDIHDIDSYFMLAFLSCGIFIAMGTYQLIAWGLSVQSGAVRSIVFLLTLALPAVQVASNIRDVDQSDNHLVEDFVQNILSDVEPNAVILSPAWDYFVSPAYYFQIVRRQRPDVTIIDKSLLQDRSWYFIQLERTHPDLVEKSKAAIQSFLLELNKFEQGTPFSFPLIQARWVELIRGLVVTSLPTHPVYIDPRIDGEFPQEFVRTPQGLLFRLTAKGDTSAWRPIKGELREERFRNYLTQAVREYLVQMHTYHSYWLNAHERKNEARDEVEKALKLDAFFPGALRLKALLSNSAK